MTCMQYGDGVWMPGLPEIQLQDLVKHEASVQKIRDFEPTKETGAGQISHSTSVVTSYD